MASAARGQSGDDKGERRTLAARLARRSLAAILCALALPPITPVLAAPAPDPAPPNAGDGRDYRVVDCLVVEPTMAIGRYARSAGRQKLKRASVDDCMTMGGQFALDDGNSVAAAVARWRPAAETGDPDAQTRLADLLRQDADGGRDPASAAAWYAKAAARGWKPAQYSLARMYEAGDGVAKDPAQASEWYAKAFGVDPRRNAGVRVADAAEIEALQARITSQGEELKLKDSEIAGLKQTVSAKEAELVRLNQAHAEDLKQITLLQAQLADQRSLLAAALDKGAKSLRDAASGQAELDALRKQIAEREADLSARETDYARRQAALAADTASLLAAQGKLGANQSEVLALRRELDRLRADLAQRASETREADTQNQQARAELAALRAALETRTREASAKEAALLAREKDLAAKEAAQSATVSASSADVEAGRKAVEAQRRDVEAERAALAGERDSLKAAADAYQAKLAAIAQREEAARAAEARYAAALKQVEVRETAVAAKEATLVKAGGALASQQSERAAIDKDRAALEADRASFAALKAQVDKRDGELGVREKLVETSFADIADQNRKLQVRQANIEKVELEARKTREEAEAAKAKYDEVLKQLASAVSGIQRGDAKTLTPTSAPAPKAPKQLNVDFGRFYAVLIANDSYSDARWPKLDTPLNDARDLKALLETKYGFKVEIVPNGTRDSIMKKINETAKRMGPTDNLLIYYAGHGRKYGNKGYWEPVDSHADGSSLYLSISYAEIADQMDNTLARKVLVISDSCFSGNMVKTRGPGLEALNESPQAVNELWKKRATLAARQWIASGNTDENVADGGGDGHSVFAQALLDELGQGGDPIMANDLYLRVSHRLGILNVPQTPQIERLRASSGDGGGDFIFAPAVVNVASR